MAFIEYSFSAKNLGDSSSATTTITAEIVSCSNTLTPLNINGYTFKTVISNVPKTGDDIIIVFDGVPVNTILPPNHKLKITGNRNGNPIVIYGDCVSGQEVICAEGSSGGCAISNVSLGQPICTSVTNILQPYSFTTTQVGLHKVELYRILPEGVPPSFVKSIVANVTNVNILQTGTIQLDVLNADNYKLYVTALGEDDAIDCTGQSTIVLLSCGGETNCIAPTFDITFNNPSCNGIIAQADGTITIKNVIGGNKVRYCNGQVWGCSDDYNIGQDITDNNSFVITNNIGMSPGAEFDYYTVRVYKDASCYKDKVIKFAKPDCGVNLCNYPEFVYNGQPITKEITHKNVTGSAQQLHFRVEPQTPINLEFYRDSVLIYATNCAGINTTGCTTCTQGGVLCAAVNLLVGQVLKIKLSALCSDVSITSMKFKSSCTAIPECVTETILGETNQCGITLPSNGIKYACNPQTNDVTTSVEGFYGGISGEYQFGFDVDRQWSLPSQVSWENSSSKILPKSKNITIWIRDKINTTCVTQLSGTTPDCIPSSIYPIIDQQSLVQNFSQNGSTLKGNVSNLESGHDYKATYKYQGDTFERGGSVDKSTNTVTFPLVAVGATMEGIITDKLTGQVSNTVRFNVLDQETIYFDVIENVCNPNQLPAGSTFLHLKLRNTNNVKVYLIKLIDSITSEVYGSLGISALNTDIYLLHTEANRKVSVQVLDNDNLLKGSQIRNITLTQLNCTAPVSECDCVQKVAYGVNTRGNGATLDSIKVIYKGTSCKRYKFYIESETNRGVYELYDNRVGANVQNVTLTGNYTEYNFMPIEAMGSRVWLNKNYKIKFEFYDSTGTTVVKVVEFVVDLTNSTPLATPVVKFECGNNNNNNCNLVDKQEIGFKSTTTRVQSRLFIGKWYSVTQETGDVSIDRFYVRGTNYLDNGLTITKAGVTKSCFDPNSTNFGGAVAPLIFQSSTGSHATPGGGDYTPDGYRRGYTGDGALFFDKATDLPSYPCDSPNCLPYTGTLPPTNGSGGITYYPLTLLEKINNNITSGQIGHIAPFSTRDEAIQLTAQYAANPTAVVNGLKADFDVVVSIRNGVYQPSFVVGDYLINNNNPPFNPGVAQCGFFVARVIENNVGLGYDIKYDILTTDNCGKIINIERRVVQDVSSGTPDMIALAGPARVLQGIVDLESTHQDWENYLNFTITYLGNNKISIVNNAPQRNPGGTRTAKYYVDYGTGTVALKGDTAFDGRVFDALFPLQIWMYWEQTGNPDLTREINWYRGYAKIVMK